MTARSIAAQEAGRQLRSVWSTYDQRQFRDRKDRLAIYAAPPRCEECGAPITGQRAQVCDDCREQAR